MLKTALSQRDLEKLDDLVSEYLLFRSYKSTQQQLFLDKKSSSLESSRLQRGIVNRIMGALDSGDYPRVITLWDTYILQKLGTMKPTSLHSEARDAEFLVHLLCALYPFHPEVIQNCGSPIVAAKVAARSMTIFKHFLETRGSRLIQKDQEFAIYRNLYRVAFPPTHPQFAHMFSDEWLQISRNRVVTFLDKFFVPAATPVLLQLYQTLGQRSEEEMTEVFRRRERKLLRFTRSIYDLSNDLLNALEAGRTIDKDFLKRFRQKFESFGSVLRPDPDDEGIELELSKGINQAANSREINEEGSNDRAFVKSLVAGKVRLDIPCIARDLNFMCLETGSELSGLLTRSTVLSAAEAAVVCQTAMQGSRLLQALKQLILRPDKEVQTDSARELVATSLCRADICGLHGKPTQPIGRNFRASDEAQYRHEFEPALSYFITSLARALKSIPQTKLPLSLAEQQLHPYERLIGGGKVAAEYICRLIATLGTTNIGLAYVSAESSKVTSAFTELLAAIQLPTATNILIVDEAAETPARISEESGSKPGIGISLCRWCLMALIALLGDCKTNQLAFIRNGGVVWISRYLRGFVRDAHHYVASLDCDTLPEVPSTQFSLPLSTSFASLTAIDIELLELCLSLLCCALRSAEAQRLLVASLNMQRETEALIGTLVLLVIKIGLSDDHAHMSIELLRFLLQEPSTRHASRELREVIMLRSFIAEGRVMSISEVVGLRLLSFIDTDEEIGEHSSFPSAHDIIISVFSVQAAIDENPLLVEFCADSNPLSILKFLSRYSLSSPKNKGRNLFNFDEIFIGDQGNRPTDIHHLASSSQFLPSIVQSPTQLNSVPRELVSRPKIPRTPANGGTPRFDSHFAEEASREHSITRSQDMSSERSSPRSARSQDRNDSRGTQDEGEGGDYDAYE